MKKLSLITLGVAFMLCSCNSKGKTEAGATTAAAETSAVTSGDLYFDYTVDGKEMHIAPGDISSNFNNTGGHPVFKIFAGADGATGVMLVVPKDMKGPSSTPSGSTSYDEQITQGSVSLQNFPEKNYTTNSFNTTYPEMSRPVADAVVISSVAADGKDAAIITGTFSAKTFGSHSKNNTDAKDTDHTVTGKFRIRHEFTSMSGDRF